MFKFRLKFHWLKFVPMGPINYIPAWVQIMACRRPGDKPLSEPMMVSLPTHICVTRPQCVKTSILLSTKSLSRILSPAQFLSISNKPAATSLIGYWFLPTVTLPHLCTRYNNHVVILWTWRGTLWPPAEISTVLMGTVNYLVSNHISTQYLFDFVFNWGKRQPIIKTSVAFLLIGPLGTNVSEIRLEM